MFPSFHFQRDSKYILLISPFLSTTIPTEIANTPTILSPPLSSPLHHIPTETANTPTILSPPLSSSLLISSPHSHRDSEYTFYSGLEFTMNAYSVKPAIFDLFLMIIIACYLAVFYFISQVDFIYIGKFV